MLTHVNMLNYFHRNVSYLILTNTCTNTEMVSPFVICGVIFLEFKEQNL